ncbi:hypothetical protein CYMTET_12605 [Cymbomonas tetramitiformis]|uniref:Uncharacterized protein n=1 Tax=Cymbomonas tetramitiformis TaxID=36881 RepID=A0AAE0GK57_9CHLO|nr:hypothetical protein CYMTET_12605 [Cymbomonas tetramitiformis]
MEGLGSLGKTGTDPVGMHRLDSWAGSWAHVRKRMVVMFPVVRGLLPHLGPRRGRPLGCTPPRLLVADLMALMVDVRGVREWVRAAEADENPMLEGLRMPEEAHAWGVSVTFGSP